MNWHEENISFNSFLKQLFQDNSWQKRAEAARQLGLLEDGRAVNLLCRALKSEKNHIVVNKIIEALGRIGDGRATLRIIEKLDEELEKLEKDKFRIVFIIESITRIKDKRALKHIGLLLNFPDDDIQNLTQQAFDLIEPNWKEILEGERNKPMEEIFK